MITLQIRRHRVVAVLVAIILATGGLFGYQVVAKYQNKKAFVGARAAIDTVYGDIVAKVGQPDNFKRTNSCSRPSREFEQGPLSCSVGTDFIYGVNDEQEANTLFRSIQAVISSHPDLLKPTKPLSTAITDTLVVNTYYHSTTDSYISSKNINCIMNYVYDTPRETFLALSPSSDKKSLFAALDCTDRARSIYYPLDL